MMIDVQKRRCLKCGKGFKSMGNGNRICHNCTSNVKRQFAPVFSTYEERSRGVRVNRKQVE